MEMVIFLGVVFVHFEEDCHIIFKFILQVRASSDGALGCDFGVSMHWLLCAVAKPQKEEFYVYDKVL